MELQHWSFTEPDLLYADLRVECEPGPLRQYAATRGLSERGTVSRARMVIRERGGGLRHRQSLDTRQPARARAVDGEYADQ